MRIRADRHARIAATVAVFLAALAFVTVSAAPALADNCDLRINPEDCQNTAWTIGAVAAVAAAITAILVALSGLGGADAEGAAEGGGVAVAEDVEEGAAGEAGGGGAGDEAPIFQQQKNDTCAIATIRMILQRVTGKVVSEEGLASRSANMTNGYKQNLEGKGTSTQGVVDFLTGLGLKASQQTLSVDQIQTALADGKQVSISYKVPGGNHRVLVTDVKKGAGNLTFISVDDPATGMKRTYAAALWWPTYANPSRTIVVEPLKNIGR